LAPVPNYSRRDTGPAPPFSTAVNTWRRCALKHVEPTQSAAGADSLILRLIQDTGF
jgi:hypothetical protein